ncbi:hypothetical protein BGX27_002818 [Mortierella sp. AM989]|nr:hypothetical protein BGX27_002818 [Mortierella sp. AM989]
MAQYMMFEPAFWKTFVTPDRYSYDQIPDLTGKVAIVTGANSGIGYNTTVGLAANGCHVIMACRSEAKCNEAIANIREEIKAKFPNAPKDVKLEFLPVDMNDLTNVQASAQAFLKKGLPLHILINNSGIGGSYWELSADGIEQQFAVNHLGPFAFTLALLDKLKESQPSRIAVVSSLSYEGVVATGIDVEEIRTDSESKLTPDVRYARSKFANILFAKALARRLSNEAVYCNVLHPGIVRTPMTTGRKMEENLSFGRRFHYYFRKSFFYVTGMPSDRGALTQLYCATSPEIETDNVRGKFFIPVANLIPTAPILDDEEKQEELWKFSEEIIEQKLKEAKARTA